MNSNAKNNISGIPTPDKGFLHSVSKKVVLDFSVNPAQLQRSEQSTYNQSQSPGAPGAYIQYIGGGDRNITFELTLDAIGAKAGNGGVKQEIAILEAFTYPDTNDLLNAQFIAPPKALLGIGARIWEGYVSQVQFTEERFNVRLEPVYVKAQITFVVDSWNNATSQRMHQTRRQLLVR